MLACRGCSGVSWGAVNAEGEFMSTIGKSLWSAISSVLLPGTCCLCGAHAQGSELDLCGVCITLLPVHHGSGDVLRAGPASVVPVVAPLRYAYPVDAWVRALKFRGERAYGRVLGVLLARARAAMRADTPALSVLPDMIVPVPLHSVRYRERGFNQALDIARFAGSLLRVPVETRWLVRPVATREQSGLSLRERRRNVRRAFRVNESRTVKRVAIVDDVVTTGSTALAAARVLLECGANEIEIWAAARAVLI
jgi:ComF family protein